MSTGNDVAEGSRRPVVELYYPCGIAGEAGISVIRRAEQDGVGVELKSISRVVSEIGTGCVAI